MALFPAARKGGEPLQRGSERMRALQRHCRLQERAGELGDVMIYLREQISLIFSATKLFLVN